MNDALHSTHIHACIVGLTGGIGSGKTTVANELRKRGYFVYDSDTEAQRIINTNLCVRSQIEFLFGSDIYVSNQLNRSRVAQLVFDNTALLTQLNNIVHPAVKQDVNVWAGKHATESILFVESAILFESGFDSLCTKTVAVIAPETLRVERVMLRDGTTAEAVQARIARQMSDNERTQRADIILCNDGKTSVENLVTDLLKTLP